MSIRSLNGLTPDSGSGGAAPEGGLSGNVVTVTGNYVMSENDDYILVNASSNPVTITLVPTSGKAVVVKKVDASSNAVTITTSSGSIDGGTSVSIPYQGSAYTLISDGVNWYLF